MASTKRPVSAAGESGTPTRDAPRAAERRATIGASAGGLVARQSLSKTATPPPRSSQSRQSGTVGRAGTQQRPSIARSSPLQSSTVGRSSSSSSLSRPSLARSALLSSASPQQARGAPGQRRPPPPPPSSSSGTPSRTGAGGRPTRVGRGGSVPVLNVSSGSDAEDAVGADAGGNSGDATSDSDPDPEWGGEDDSAESENEPLPSSSTESVSGLPPLVAVRVRPVATAAEAAEAERCWEVEDRSLRDRADGREFSAPGGAYRPSSSVLALFHRAVRPLVHAALRGVHGSVLAYGPPGSGKTRTLFGSVSDAGLVGLAAEELLAEARQMDDQEFLVRASFLHVLDEEVRDLLPLGGGAPVPLLVRQVGGKDMFAVPGAREMPVSRASDVQQLLLRGQRCLRESARESRDADAHSRETLLFRLTVEAAPKPERRRSRAATSSSAGAGGALPTVLLADLVFADLPPSGGSCERPPQSLAALHAVVRALGDPVGGPAPFGSGVVTKLLRRCLGGAGLTALVCHVVATEQDRALSRAALEFCELVARVRNDPKPHRVAATGGRAALAGLAARLQSLNKKLATYRDLDDAKRRASKTHAALVRDVAKLRAQERERSDLLVEVADWAAAVIGRGAAPQWDDSRPRRPAAAASSSSSSGAVPASFASSADEVVSEEQMAALSRQVRDMEEQAERLGDEARLRRLAAGEAEDLVLRRRREVEAEQRRCDERAEELQRLQERLRQQEASRARHEAEAEALRAQLAAAGQAGGDGDSVIVAALLARHEQERSVARREHDEALNLKAAELFQEQEVVRELRAQLKRANAAHQREMLQLQSELRVRDESSAAVPSSSNGTNGTRPRSAESRELRDAHEQIERLRAQLRELQ